MAANRGGRWAVSAESVIKNKTVGENRLDPASSQIPHRIEIRAMAAARQRLRACHRFLLVHHGFTGSSMVLTCAATMRQPCGNRTQVCIVRVILPGARG